MASTLTRQNVIDEALDDSFDATRYGSLAARWLNEGVGRICRRVPSLQRNARLVIATVAGTADYALPSDIVRVDNLIDPDGNEIVEVDPLELAELATQSTRGNPVLFCQESSTQGSSVPVTITPALRLWPTPSSARNLALRYVARAAVLDDSSDVIPLDDDYGHLLVMWIRMRAFAKEDDFQASAWWRGEFERELAEMRADTGRPTSNRRHRTPSMFDGPTEPRFVRPS